MIYRFKPVRKRGGRFIQEGKRVGSWWFAACGEILCGGRGKILQRVSENPAADAESGAYVEKSALHLKCKDTKNKGQMQIFRPKF